MFCILDESLALRNWLHAPYQVIKRGSDYVQAVKKIEYETLLLCDAQHDLAENGLLQHFLKIGWIHPCQQGKGSLSQWQKPRYYPNRRFPSVLWSITEQCNYACLHCFLSTGQPQNSTSILLVDAEKLLDQMEKCGVLAVSLTGGEPMLHSHFLRIVHMIIEHNMSLVSINTNGSLITDELLVAMHKLGCNPLMKISFDGLEWHDWLRNFQGAESKTLQAIQLCVSHGFKVMVQMNVHCWNLKSLVPTANRLEKMGVYCLRLIRTTEAPQWANIQPEATLSFADYYNSMLDFARQYLNCQREMILDFYHFLTLNPRTHYYSLYPIRHNNKDSLLDEPVCPGNRNMISIAVDGELYPCHAFTGLYRLQGKSLGNVNKEPLSQLLTESSYTNVVCKTVSQLATQNDTCAQCQWFQECCGGCRAMATLYQGSYEGSDPMACTFFQYGYPEKTQQLLQGWHTDA